MQMENITDELAYFKTYHKHKPPIVLVLGNTDNQELTEGTNIYIAQLCLVELIGEIQNILGYKNYRNGTWGVCEDSDCSTE